MSEDARLSTPAGGKRSAQSPPTSPTSAKGPAPVSQLLSAPQSLRDLLAADGGASPTRRQPPARREAAGVSDAHLLAASPTDGPPRPRNQRTSVSSSNAADRRSSASSASRAISPPPRTDETRWNGWHLWRQESADAKRMREIHRRSGLGDQRASSSGAASAPSVKIQMKRWSRRFYGSLRGIWTGGIDLDEEDEDQEADPLALANQADKAYDPESPLSRFKLAALTVSLAGAQIAWTLELAYGTPFLLSLGLSKEAVSLVWLAGPASGLIVQPLVGAISDADVESKFRRRKWMIISAFILCLSTLALAFVRPIAFFLVDIFGVGLGDWDPKRNKIAHHATQTISVVAFWVLDFALNGLQASSRALILDLSPTRQQTDANAWQGMMTNAGNVVGYFVGWVDLATWAGLSWLGGDQFRKFSLFSLVSMVVCVTITCATCTEHPHLNLARESIQPGTGGTIVKPTAWQRLRNTVRDIQTTMRRLPRPVRRLCATQFFNFAAWYSFLFFSTTYYLEIKQNWERTQHGKHPDGHADAPTTGDRDFEQGSFSLLMYAIVALGSGFVLPFFALGSDARARAPSLPETVISDDRHVSQGWWKRRARRVWRGIRYGLTLRTMWSLGCFAYAVIMLGTFFVETPTQAIVLIALVGLPWSITAWTPYALIGEFVRETALGLSPYEFDDDHNGPLRSEARRQERRQKTLEQTAVASARERRAGFPLHSPGEEGAPLAEHHSGFQTGPDAAKNQVNSALVDCEPLRPGEAGSSARPSNRREVSQGTAAQHDEGAMAGTVLGIHNLAIVIPQLMMSFVSSVLFRITKPKGPKNGGGGGEDDDDDSDQARLVRLASVLLKNTGEGGGKHRNSTPQVAWLLRFGGLMALCACLAARAIPLTRTERFRRGELVELRLDEDEVEEDPADDTLPSTSNDRHGPIQI